jgi:hypothetical protein
VSALRKEEPFPTTDAASQKRASVGPARTDRTEGLDEADIEPGSRRPPRSVANTATDETSDRVIDDTYDGEIISSTVEPTAPSAPTAPVSQAGAPRPDRSSETQAATPGTAFTQASGADTHLFDEEELRDFRARWDQVQTSFVDEPRHAVELADALVGTVVKRIGDQFDEERAKLEKQGDHGQNVSTEDLRQHFKRYRAFFDRLLGF